MLGPGYSQLPTDVLADTVAHLVFCTFGQLRNVKIRKPSLLGISYQTLVPLFEWCFLYPFVHVDDVFEFVKIPPINLGQVVQLIDSVIEIEHGMGDGEQAPVVVLGQGSVHILRFPIRVEASEIRVDLSDSLLQ